MRQSKVTLEPNHHLAKVVRLGEVRDDGLLKLFIPLIRRFHQFLQFVKETKGFGVTGLIQIRQEVQDNIGKFLNCRGQRGGHLRAEFPSVEQSVRDKKKRCRIVRRSVWG